MEQNVLAQDFKDYWNVYKTKSENKNTMNTDIFLNQTLFETIDCLYQFINIKITMLKDLNLKDITYQNVSSKIITLSSMEKP